MTNGVSAQENPSKRALCMQVITATIQELGGSTNEIYHYSDLGGLVVWGESWHVLSKSGESDKFRERCGFIGSIIYENYPEKGKKDRAELWSNVSDTFHGHKAIWYTDLKGSRKTGDTYGHTSLLWLIEPWTFSVNKYFFEESGTDLSYAEKAVLDTAEIMYKYIIEFGLVEPPNCLTMSTVQNVKVIYPDGTEKICREPTTIDLVEGMTFKALNTEKGKIKAMYKASEAPKSEMPIIRLPNKVLYDLEQVRIKNLKVTDGSSDMTYEAKMKDEGMVWTVSSEPEPEPKVGTIGPIPRDIAFLMDVFEERITVSRTEIYTKVIVKEVFEAAAIYVGLIHGPLGIPAIIYNEVDTAGEKIRAVEHIFGPCKNTDFYIAPRGIYGSVVTRSGKILHNSCGVIGITNNKTEVYVFEGEFQLSDLNETKTVTVYANQSSTCELGSVPTDPKPFDQSSVGRLWETVHETITVPSPTAVPMPTPTSAPLSTPAPWPPQSLTPTPTPTTAPTSTPLTDTGKWTDDGSGCWTIIDGIHTMTGTSESIIARCLYHNQEFCDFTFEVDMQKTSGDKPGHTCTYGLHFRGDGTKENCYFFTITATGLYLISKKVEGEYITMLGATPSDSLKTGYNEWNTLTVIARGSTTEFFINDDLVASMGDESFLCGKVGLYAIDSSTSDAPDIIQFRNIQITELQGVTPTPTPTPNPNLIPPQSGFPILP